MIGKALLILACFGNLLAEESVGKLQLVATTGMVGDLVRNVVGDRAQVDVIIDSGVDPHLYRPGRADMLRLQRADAIFYNGLMLEGKMQDLFRRMAANGTKVVAVAEGAIDQQENLLRDEENKTDPHLWMDVQVWIAALGSVEEAMIRLDPEGADLYRANAARYREQMKVLDRYARETLATIPEANRILVTAHDAFQYLGRAYKIQVRGIQGLSTESEAGVRDIEDLVRFLVEKKIPAVFVESSVSDKNVRALMEGARAKGHSLVLGGELFSDAMGASGTVEGTYLGMIEHNVNTITRALGGQVPEGGAQLAPQPAAEPPTP